MKETLDKYYSIHQKEECNIHVTNLTNSAIVKLVLQSLQKVDINLRTNLYSEIVLSGGNTMFEGFPERFIQ